MGGLAEYLSVSAKVEVGGEEVRVLHLTDPVKVADFSARWRKMLDMPTDAGENARKSICAQNELTADMLDAVVDTYSYTREQWVLVARAATEPANKGSGLPELVQSVFLACGVLHHENSDPVFEAHGDVPFLPPDLEVEG